MLEKVCRPQELQEIKHVPCARILETFTAEDFPSMLLVGAEGAGKRALLNAFMKHIFGRVPQYTPYTVEVNVSPSKRVEVEVLESEDALEVRATMHGSYDKKIVQRIAKDLSETQSIKNALSSEKKRAKMLIIPEGENLTQGAQMSLRRIMEQGASNFRIVIMSTTINGYIEAFKSRFLICRVPAMSPEHMQEVIERAVKIENVFIDEKKIKEIVRDSEGNARKAFALAEIVAHVGSSISATKWESDIDDIAKEIIRAPSIKGVAEARDKIYKILDKGIPGNIVLTLLTKKILQKEKSLEIASALLKYSGVFDARIGLGKKDIFHLEAFIARAASIYYKSNTSIHSKSK